MRDKLLEEALEESPEIASFSSTDRIMVMIGGELELYRKYRQIEGRYGDNSKQER